MINGFDFVLPTRIRYGAGMVKVLPEELQRLNVRKVMLITDKGLVAAGLVEPVTALIRQAGISLVIYDEIEANPKDYNVVQAATVARETAVDAVVAFGGGSPIDAAKAVVVLARQGGKVRDYQGQGKIKEDCLPLITIPTTAGTGSEVTFSSVITDTEEKFKFTIKSPAIAPKVAIVDPELTLSVPPAVTAATGIDALTHAIEGYTANCTEPIAEAVGLYAVEYIAGSIVEAVKNGGNLQARDRMMMGSLLAGLSFSHADVASVHCMAEALGSLYDAPHGLCNAILLPYVMEFNLPDAEYKYARVSRAMGMNGADDHQVALQGIARIRQMSQEIGLPGIRSLNVQPADFDLLAAMSEKNGSNDSNPRKISKKDYRALFVQAYEDCRH
ncbi:MAG TPA: iron-containing alcohol dehydrogenase [Patescibacteria group bacterium]|nr:iron-containing alcohol dehydrogenase [Patescibacteria group bacterium]